MQDNVYKYRLKLIKQEELSYISHLDWQNLILKIFRRLDLKLILSQGFNKMPKVSYSPALPIFLESDCELVDFQVAEPIDNDFIKNFKKAAPKGIKVVDIQDVYYGDEKSLDCYIQWAKYEAKLIDKKNCLYNLDEIRYIIEKCLSSNELLILKKTKKGIEKEVNYRNSLKTFEIRQDGTLLFVLKAGQSDDIKALRADDFLKKIFGDSDIFKIKRIEFYDKKLNVI